jgi:hypothetical protein
MEKHFPCLIRKTKLGNPCLHIANKQIKTIYRRSAAGQQTAEDYIVVLFGRQIRQNWSGQAGFCITRVFVLIPVQ